MVYFDHHVVLPPATKTLIIVAITIFAIALFLLAASIAMLTFSIRGLPFLLEKVLQDQKERLVEKKQQ
jgi:hypothetical protein